MTDAILSVHDLETRIVSERGEFCAVDGVSLHADRGEAIGLIGESGSGKSLTARSLARLLPKQARMTAGSIHFDGENLAEVRDEKMRKLRRSDIAMIFQDPSSYLNPIMTIGDQIAEASNGRAMRRATDRERVFAALASVRIADPARVAASYPHELSGGMQQRAMIAAALIRNPRLIIADEPTTGLDATVQTEVLKLLAEACASLGTALLFISHDLAAVAAFCQRVYIMYAGQIVEEGPVHGIFNDPRHPYTRALLDSILDPWDVKPKATQIAGDPPDLSDPPPGCRFHPRCSYRFEPCSHRAPSLEQIGMARAARCWLVNADAAAAHE